MCGYVNLKRVWIIWSLLTIFLVVEGSVKEILQTDSENDNFLNFANQNYRANPGELLSRTQNIINKYPQNALAHLVRGKIYYLAIGNIEKAVYELNAAERLINQIKNKVDSLNVSQKRIFVTVRDDHALLIEDIQRCFGDLKFKIRGVTISKLARISDVSAIFQYDLDTYHQAEDFQQKRFDFLKDQLKNVSFQFADWDTSRKEMFFKIKFFPIIFTDITEPYSLTINNECRYHFNFTGPDDRPIEIYWSDNYRLVESIPEMFIGIKHSKSLKLTPQYPAGEIITQQPFSLDETGSKKINTYIPMMETETVEIHIDPDYPGEKIAKSINLASEITVGILIILAIIMTR